MSEKSGDEINERAGWWVSEICDRCKHYNVDNSLPMKGGQKCAAFPDGIPDEIWLGKNDHTKPYPGDHGIQFEKAE